jgi:hypothetical protein
MRAGAVASESGVLVTFPNNETRRLAPGPSSIITQAVIEVFAKDFLEYPAVLWLSESGNKVVARDDEIAAAIGLNSPLIKRLFPASLPTEKSGGENRLAACRDPQR